MNRPELTCFAPTIRTPLLRERCVGAPLVSMAQDKRAVVKNVDMSDEMQTDAIDVATQALDRFNIEKDIAAFIKKEFDKKYGPTWHVVVGRSFGSFVTHETKHFIYAYIGQIAFQLWKCG